jgi:hypothetical protein
VFVRQDDCYGRVVFEVRRRADGQVVAVSVPERDEQPPRHAAAPAERLL